MRGDQIHHHTGYSYTIDNIIVAECSECRPFKLESAEVKPSVQAFLCLSMWQRPLALGPLAHCFHFLLPPLPLGCTR